MASNGSQPAHSQLKRASVLVLITQDWHILLTRSKQLESNPILAMFAFPAANKIQKTFKTIS
jgi:hypothetical protein